MSGQSAENDAGLCGASHQAIDNGAPCKYLAGHLVAGIPHTTANGFWWSDDPSVTSPDSPAPTAPELLAGDA